MNRTQIKFSTTMKIVILICLLCSCNDTKTNDYNLTEKYSELYSKGLEQGRQQVAIQSRRKAKEFICDNYLEKLLLTDSLFCELYKTSGSPKITYLDFLAHDAMTDEYGIKVNNAKYYTEIEFREIVVEQLGVFSALRN